MTDSEDKAAAAAPANDVFAKGFFRDTDFDFETRLALGNAAQGIFDVGLVLATIAKIADGDADSWYAAWRATAEALDAEAAASRAAGHEETAARFFLGASEAYSQAIGFSDAMSDQSQFAPVFALHRAAFDAFVDASAPRVERIAVPYENTTLPGYLFRPDASGAPRPTLVLTNGSDGSISSLWASGASTAVARGWNAFLYDGPGQQTMLFDHDVPFRPDWEAVLTPVVDALVARPDVDAAKLLAYGISQAGYWLPRALAFEKRFVAAVADPGVMDVSTSWTAQLPPVMIQLLTSGNADYFNGAMKEAEADPKLAATLAFRSRPFGTASYFDTYSAVLGYNLRDVVGQISTPLLITAPEDEQFWPGQSQQLYDALPGEKVLAEFTREQGANFHCQPLGRQLTEARMFDFFDEHLARG
jgi:dienelactone hydrolase